MTKKKEPHELLVQGVESTYTEEIASKVLEMIATHPNGFIELKQMYPWFPNRATWFNWTCAIPGLLDRYLKAKQDQQHTVCDEMTEIVRNIPTFIDDRGVERIDSGMVQRAKLQADTMKWQMARLAPKTYGERIEHDVSSSIAKEALDRKRVLDSKNKKDY